MGKMIPIACFEVLPGDTIQQASSVLLRLVPMMAPVMHPLHVRIHHWYVPLRLIWEDFEDFITGGPDGMNTSVPPHLQKSSIGTSSLYDYLSIPPGSYDPVLEFSSLPMRAYTLIFNEWYRDQDLQDEIDFPVTSGVDSFGYDILPVCWERDYFTTARPWPQKGPQVTIPIGGTAPVTGAQGITIGGVTGSSAGSFNRSLYTGDYTAGAYNVKSDSQGSINVSSFPHSHNGQISGDLYVDLSQSTAVNLEDLRLAFALQRYEEARARYGSRYTEYLRYLGVRSSDARLQRPEYLGGGRQTVQMSEVLQTAEGSDPVGTMRGHGITAMRSNRYRRFFEEHGFILSILSIRPKTIYADGLPRMYSRKVKEDYFQRELQHIGDQEVFNREVYAPQSATRDEIFGYQDRYDEYRRIASNVSGEFRLLLNYWHMAREFASAPALNEDFVVSNPSKRIFAEQTQHPVYIMASHSIQARRQLAKVAKSFIY
jgi:hypothetical protein